MALPVPNFYVLWISLFVHLGIYATGMLAGSVNGILVMEGFQQTFGEFYGSSSSESEPSTSMNRTCSSGNGASADALIGIFVSLANLMQILGFMMTGWMADILSRKYTLLIGGLFLTAGSAVLASSFHIWVLFIGRALTGFSAGVLYMMCSLYVAEVCPKEVRGMMTSITGLIFNMGFLVALFANWGFSKFFVGWRVAFAVVAGFALSFAVGMKFMPHTPRWLVKRGRHKEALLVLTRMNSNSGKETFVDTYVELEDIKESITIEYKWLPMVKEVYRLKYRLFVSVMLFLLSSSSLFFIWYSTTLFCLVEVPPFTSGLALGVVVLIGGLVPTFLADKVGRKPILLFCCTLNFAAGFLAALLFQLFESPRSDLVAYSIVALIYVYAFGYSSAWLSLPWVIGTEAFPNDVRGLTFAISCISFGLFGFVFNQLIPVMIGSPIQLEGLLYMVAIINLLGALFVFVAVPETKGVALEDMDKLFSQNCWEIMKHSIWCKMPESQKTQLDLSCKD